MKIYDIDVHTLSAEEKAKVREQLNRLAFFVTDVLSASEGLIAIRVYWDSKEDFFSSPFFPSSCPCKEFHPSIK